jgi:DNA-binding IclR family transcriptional regulator
MNNTDKNEGTIKTSGTVFDVLEMLIDQNGVTVTEVKEHLGVSKSTAHRHLNSLKERKYLIQRGNEYDLSFRFLRFSEYLTESREGLELTKQMVDDLAEMSGEHAQFFVEEHGWAVYTYGKAGKQAVYSEPGLGNTVHLHATAAGKALLAHLPEEDIEQYIEERELRELTENTITEESELREELDRVRDQGYALNREENIKGLRAVGVSVNAPNQDLFGAISISGPTRRINGSRFREDLPEHILGRANELELNIALAQEET